VIRIACPDAADPRLGDRRDRNSAARDLPECVTGLDCNEIRAAPERISLLSGAVSTWGRSGVHDSGRPLLERRVFVAPPPLEGSSAWHLEFFAPAERRRITGRASLHGGDRGLARTRQLTSTGHRHRGTEIFLRFSSYVGRVPRSGPALALRSRRVCDGPIVPAARPAYGRRVCIVPGLLRETRCTYATGHRGTDQPRITRSPYRGSFVTFVPFVV
jgi:hypothetical protein